MHNPDQQILHHGLQRAWLFWSAMAATLLVYVAITQVFATGVVPAPHPAYTGKTAVIVYGVALIAFGFAGAIRRTLLAARAGPPGQPHTRLAIGRYLTAVIVSVAICETVAILGLVLHFIGVNDEVTYTVVIASAVAMFIYRPRRSELERLAAALAPR